MASLVTNPECAYEPECLHNVDFRNRMFSHLAVWPAAAGWRKRNCQNDLPRRHVSPTACARASCSDGRACATRRRREASAAADLRERRRGAAASMRRR